MRTRSDLLTNASRSAVSDEVIDLGRLLVTELGLEDSTDTLGRWMAHYIAELIADVEQPGKVKRREKEARCATAILELWRHRHDVTQGRRQFEPESLLRAITSLDPETTRHRYFAHLRETADAENEAVKEWLCLADGIDGTARMLVLECLVGAAASAGDRSREWISMLEAARIEDDPPTIAVRFVNEQGDLMRHGGQTDANRKRLSQRLDRLNEFLRLARILRRHLATQVDPKGASKRQSTTRRKQPRGKAKASPKAKKMVGRRK